MRRLMHWRWLMGLLALGCTAAEAGERVIVIGTAPVSGVYFPAGGAVCNMVNRERTRHGLRCLVESTGGSAENLDRLRDGDVDLALVQSDWQYLAAHNGHGPEGEVFADLRAVFSLHGQPITVVARSDARIETLSDLKNRRVGLGPEGSGIRAAAEALFGALDWSPSDFAEVVGLTIDAQVDSLCAGRIDAFVLPMSHPNGAVAAAIDGCDAVLVDVAGAAVDRLTEAWPFYAPVTIPGGLYRGYDRAIKSYGARATLVTTASLPAEVVYEVVRAAFGNIEALARQHAALAGLRAEAMVGAGNTAPFHEGALRYFNENGLK